MENHDIEIEIGPDGKVHADIKGMKGRACLAYVEFLQEVVGKIVSQEYTAEFYEPDSQVRVEPLIRQEGRE